MKRASLLISLLLATTLFLGCSHTYSGWVTIKIGNYGTLKIPQNWTYYVDNGLIYFTDADSSPMMIQTLSYSGTEENQEGCIESNDFFENVTNLRTLSSSGLSNGAIWGKALIAQGDSQTERYYLDIGYTQRVLLIVWDHSVDEKTLQKIAESFVSI